MKMGHGGTLDPMATGVLVVGVGSGTKSLNKFLECTKSYETVVLFGAATDSYDVEGKVVKRAPYKHITKEAVEEALGKFRGKIMQKPPVFSALRVQGKRLYEYAREGKEIPVEIQERPVEVEQLEMLEWIEGGSHDFHWPEREAEQADKDVVEKVLHLNEVVSEDKAAKEHEAETKDLKRKRDEDANGTVTDDADAGSKKAKTEAEPVMSGALPETTNEQSNGEAKDGEKAEPKPRCPAPAARLRMTVTSGFYVRSLCHDLGASVGSLGMMSELVRSRQGNFELGKNVLEYDDLAKGEDVWGPQVTEFLAQWSEKGEPVPEPRPENREGRSQQKKKSPPREEQGRKRNTSSPEE